MNALTRRDALSMTAALAVVAMGGTSALAQKFTGPGVTETEIKIGNIMPYSGPASAYGSIGKTEAAYFKMINDNGGINGRKINFISVDDAYSPPKAVEQARKLVESEEALMVFNSLGTPSNTAIQKYLNERKVPQLFVATGAAKWDDPKAFPWTMGWQPSYQAEGRIYAQYILKNMPDAKIAILSQNDDFGKDYVKGFIEGLAGKLKPVMHLTYEVGDPTIDSQMLRLKDSGATVFYNVTTPKFASQAIRKAGEMKWTATQFLANVSGSVGSVFKPAGFENGQGVLSTNYIKDATDPVWKDDPGFKRWSAFMDKYIADGDRTNSNYVYGYTAAQGLAWVLEKCGDNLSRENVMKMAASMKDVEFDMLLPGIKVNTSPTDFAPISQEQMQRFKGEGWERFGPVYDGSEVKS